MFGEIIFWQLEGRLTDEGDISSGASIGGAACDAARLISEMLSFCFVSETVRVRSVQFFWSSGMIPASHCARSVKRLIESLG